MPRRYRINFGRKTVKPFKEHDINNMLVICKKRRNRSLSADLHDGGSSAEGISEGEAAARRNCVVYQRA